MAKHIHIHGKFVAPMARAVRDAATRDDFKEADHPRAPDGRFGNKAGQHSAKPAAGGGQAKAAPAPVDHKQQMKVALQMSNRYLQVAKEKAAEGKADVAAEAKKKAREWHAKAMEHQAEDLKGQKKQGQAKPANTAYEAAPNLSKEDRAIEDRLGQKVTQHYDEAVKEYDKLPDAGGGRVLNTDTARELSPDYMKDRTKSAAVHEPASYFIKKLYAQKLASMPEDGRVVFTSGGTGAGKTTAVQNVAAMQHLTEGAHIVYDTNMNTEASAVKKIDQALAAGAGHVHIVHVQRDPVEALVLGALKRAASQAEKFGTGRTVPLVEHAKTHVGAAKTVQALAEKYKDDPRVHIDIIDNTQGKGKARLAGMDFIKNFDYTDVERKLNHALETEYKAGRVPEAVYRATKGT